MIRGQGRERESIKESNRKDVFYRQDAEIPNLNHFRRVKNVSRNRTYIYLRPPRSCLTRTSTAHFHFSLSSGCRLAVSYAHSLWAHTFRKHCVTCPPSICIILFQDFMEHAYFSQFRYKHWLQSASQQSCNGTYRACMPCMCIIPFFNFIFRIQILCYKVCS